MLASSYGWTKEYILSDMTIPEMKEYFNRIMLSRAVDKYDMFITASAPHSKKGKEIGNSYHKEVIRYSNKLKSHRQEPMQKDEAERLVKFLGGGNKLKKK